MSDLVVIAFLTEAAAEEVARSCSICSRNI